VSEARNRADAERLYRSARQAERAGLGDVARALYAKLAEKHPDSSLAEKARAKLAGL
jgi:hypothetical protein